MESRREELSQSSSTTDLSNILREKVAEITSYSESNELLARNDLAPSVKLNSIRDIDDKNQLKDLVCAVREQSSTPTSQDYFSNVNRLSQLIIHHSSMTDQEKVTQLHTQFNECLRAIEIAYQTAVDEVVNNLNLPDINRLLQLHAIQEQKVLKLQDLESDFSFYRNEYSKDLSKKISDMHRTMTTYRNHDANSYLFTTPRVIHALDLKNEFEKHAIMEKLSLYNWQQSDIAEQVHALQKYLQLHCPVNANSISYADAIHDIMQDYNFHASIIRYNLQCKIDVISYSGQEEALRDNQIKIANDESANEFAKLDKELNRAANVFFRYFGGELSVLSKLNEEVKNATLRDLPSLFANNALKEQAKATVKLLGTEEEYSSACRDSNKKLADIERFVTEQDSVIYKSLSSWMSPTTAPAKPWTRFGLENRLIVSYHNQMSTLPITETDHARRKLRTELPHLRTNTPSAIQLQNLRELIAFSNETSADLNQLLSELYANTFGTYQLYPTIDDPLNKRNSFAFDKDFSALWYINSSGEPLLLGWLVESEKINIMHKFDMMNSRNPVDLRLDEINRYILRLNHTLYPDDTSSCLASSGQGRCLGIHQGNIYYYEKGKRVKEIKLEDTFKAELLNSPPNGFGQRNITPIQYASMNKQIPSITTLAFGGVIGEYLDAHNSYFTLCWDYFFPQMKQLESQYLVKFKNCFVDYQLHPEDREKCTAMKAVLTDGIINATAIARSPALFMQTMKDFRSDFNVLKRRSAEGEISDAVTTLFEELETFCTDLGNNNFWTRMFFGMSTQEQAIMTYINQVRKAALDYETHLTSEAKDALDTLLDNRPDVANVINSEKLIDPLTYFQTTINSNNCSVIQSSAL